MNFYRIVLGISVLSGCAGETPELDDALVGHQIAAECAAPDSGVHGDAGRERRPGDGCQYVTSEGTAVIEAITEAGADINRCDRDPVQVRFHFEADDPNAAREARVITTTGELTIGGGMAPPRACITSAGLQVGSRIRVKRLSIVDGACSPTVFRFDESITDVCDAQCFQPR